MAVILRERSDRRISVRGIPPDRRTLPPEILRRLRRLRMTRKKCVILRERSDRRISGRGIPPDRRTLSPEIHRRLSAAQDDAMGAHRGSLNRFRSREGPFTRLPWLALPPSNLRAVVVKSATLVLGVAGLARDDAFASAESPPDRCV
jgi:hypothetical protein